MAQYDKQVFANRLRGKRAERHMTQQDLASLVGLSLTTICKYETAESTPSAGNVYALSVALGTTPQWLMGWD